MLVGSEKQRKDGHSNAVVEPKPHYAWKERTYVVPTPSKRGFRWKASALRGLRRWISRPAKSETATVVVPALYNLLPAETMAMGWLNEIDALHTIRHRMTVAARITGWDVFTFHTLHNLDHYYDSTITTVRETWTHEGSLSADAVRASKALFTKAYAYHQLQARLVENLVFQSSLMDWITTRAEGIPLRFHVVGTALYSALVWSGSVRIEDAVDSAMKVGSRWDCALRSIAEERATRSVRSTNFNEIGWQHFELVRKLIEGEEHVSLAVRRLDLPKAEAPSRPFWYSAAAGDEPVLIETSRDAALALESLNVASLSCAGSETLQYPISGWLVSPSHAVARSCRWSVSNYLLATPASVTMFLDHIASIGLKPVLVDPPIDQNRFRLSRIKVTGP